MKERPDMYGPLIHGGNMENNQKKRLVVKDLPGKSFVALCARQSFYKGDFLGAYTGFVGKIDEHQNDSRVWYTLFTKAVSY
jgi:hypothetical protein